MENVVVHIISHSHWDREWYLPFEVTGYGGGTFDNLLISWKWSEFGFPLEWTTLSLFALKPWQECSNYNDEPVDATSCRIEQSPVVMSQNTLIGQLNIAKWGKSTPFTSTVAGNMGQISSSKIGILWPWCEAKLTTKSRMSSYFNSAGTQCSQSQLVY